MKRKIISVMLTGTMIAGMLTGCGSDSSSKSSASVNSGSSETETETTKADTEESDDKTPVTFEYFNAEMSSYFLCLDPFVWQENPT